MVTLLLLETSTFLRFVLDQYEFKKKYESEKRAYKSEKRAYESEEKIRSEKRHMNLVWFF